MNLISFSRVFAAAAVVVGAAMPAHATVSVFTTTLSSAAEAPPNASLGSGTATVSFDDSTFAVSVFESWAGLSGNVTVNHIHVASAPGGTGGVVLGFPVANPSPPTGSFSGTFTLTNTAFNSLLTSTNAGLAYVNLHSTAFGGGELRGFLAPVPEASTYAMMLAGIAAMGAAVRRKIA